MSEQGSCFKEKTFLFHAKSHHCLVCIFNTDVVLRRSVSAVLYGGSYRGLPLTPSQPALRKSEVRPPHFLSAAQPRAFLRSPPFF